MLKRRLTLRVTQTTDVQGAVRKLEVALREQGVSNPSLSELLLETAQRLQSQITTGHTINQHDVPLRQNEANTLIRGDGYSIRITTQQASARSRLIDRMLGRPAAFS